MQNDRQKQNDLWIKQSLGNASNWEELDENDRNSLRKTMALYILFANNLPRFLLRISAIPNQLLVVL